MSKVGILVEIEADVDAPKGADYEMCLRMIQKEVSRGWFTRYLDDGLPFKVLTFAWRDEQ